MSGAFITATGTGVGKTFVTRGLARALRRRGHPVAAVKPLETGCQPEAEDALALAAACDRPALADAPGLYRVEPPLAPYAASLQGCPAPPPPAGLARTIRGITNDSVALVEGAGGLLVPLDDAHTMADLAGDLALPLLLVATDGLGVLSHTLTAHQCARQRGLTLRGVVLVRHASPDPTDPSTDTNARILAERIDEGPVLVFPPCADDDEALADAASQCGLVDLFAP